MKIMKTNSWYLPVALFVALLILASAGIHAQELAGSDTGDQSEKQIDALKRSLDSAVQHETMFGCVEQSIFGSKFCGESKERIEKLEADLSGLLLKHQARSREEQEKVTHLIRAFRGNPDLAIAFDGSSATPFMPYSKVEFYLDDNGVEYWINPATNKLVRVDFAKSGVRFNETPSRAVEDLEAVAVDFLSAKVANFTEVQHSFRMRLIDCRSDDDFCSFRWESRRWTNKNDMPPFVQITLSKSGEFAGFIDTQSLY